MKKLFMYCLFILSISPLLALAGVSTPVKADDVIVVTETPTITPSISDSDYEDYSTLGYIFEYLRQGGTIDMSNVSPTYTSRNFVDDFADFVDDVLDEVDYQINKWLSPLPDYSNKLVPVTNLLLQNGVDTLYGLLPNYFANQNGDNPTPTPQPDVDYAFYIDRFTHLYYIWSNTIPYDVDMLQTNRYSVSATHDIWDNVYNYSYALGGSNYIVACDMITVRITQADNNDYIVDIDSSINVRNDVFGYWYGGQNYYYRAMKPDSYTSSSNVMRMSFNNNNINSITFPQTFDSMTSALSFLNNKLWNFNLYVNGVPWVIVNNNPNPSYSLDISSGAVVPTTNGRVEWKYDEEIYIDIDLIWQLLDELVNNRDLTPVIDLSSIEDCIVDVNGQKAIATVSIIDADTIDDYLVKNFGTLIPVFPVTASFPVAVETVASIVTIPVSVIPSDLMDILEYIFFGTLMVCLLQRLLE